MVRYLIYRGADVTYEDEFLRTPFLAALANIHILSMPLAAYENRLAVCYDADIRFMRSHIDTADFRARNYTHHSPDVNWSREVTGDDWTRTAMVFLERVQVPFEANTHIGRRHPIQLIALESAPFELAKIAVFSDKFNLDYDVLGDLAFDLVIYHQVDKLKFCLDYEVIKRDQVMCGEETLLGRIIREVKPECLHVYMDVDQADLLDVNTVGISKEWTYFSSLTLLLSGAGTDEPSELDDKLFEMLLMLLSHPALIVNRPQTKKGYRAVHQAAAIYDRRFLHALLQHKGVKVNLMSTSFQQENLKLSPLQIAIQSGHEENIRMLCQHPNINVHGTRNNALIQAVTRQMPDLVKLLLDMGANPNEGQIALNKVMNPYQLNYQLANFIMKDEDIPNEEKRRLVEERIHICTVLRNAGAIEFKNHGQDSIHEDTHEDIVRMLHVMRTPLSLRQQVRAKMYKLLRSIRAHSMEACEGMTFQDQKEVIIASLRQDYGPKELIDKLFQLSNSEVA